ncbi:uncharacterized protein LOC119733725 [Patiria miniata]|uniref:Uncharacterized protein n=1 Tax=Patiria miniata TaxID=46514 RepID=A0A914AI20_PATMI|nr:uncharacterized protein LOC119733725 [Patiria miniata]
MAAPKNFYTPPTSSSSSSLQYDAAGSRNEVREYYPSHAQAQPKGLAGTDPKRLERLEQRMMTRAEDGSAPYPNAAPNKSRRAEMNPSARFELTGVRHAVPAITEAVEELENQGSKKMKRDGDAQSDEATPDPEDGFPWGYTGDAVPYTKPSGTPEEQKEREACKDLAFNIIQSIFVPCILKKVDEMCSEQCYGCNLPIAEDFTQKNHECLMLDVSDKVERYFDKAVDDILETGLGKCRSEWNTTAKENKRIVSQYSTIHARNRLFTKYVDMHVKKRVEEPENGRAVLYNICHIDG